MSRMSARFIARQIGMSTEWVYDIWKDMGLVVRDNWEDWILTELGKQIGGKMSQNSQRPVPTFIFETIEKMMIDFYNNYRK